MNKITRRLPAFLGVILLAFLLYACPPPCSRQLINISPIPDSILNMVPYQDKDSVFLKHSSGSVIGFRCTRFLRTDFVDCERGCCSTIEYEIDQTTLKANYPLPNIEIIISKMDEEIVDMNLSFARSWFGFPLYDSQLFFVEVLEIDGKPFNDVWAIKTQSYYSYGETHTLYPDSLFYNKEFGIIKIKMTNGESYNYYE